MNKWHSGGLLSFSQDHYVSSGADGQVDGTFVCEKFFLSRRCLSLHSREVADEMKTPPFGLQMINSGLCPAWKPSDVRI